MVPIEEFKTIMEHTPLITIDFICKDKNNKILLGRRVNNPAKDYYFTPGGRVFKKETIEDAIKRLSIKELGIEIKQKDLVFNGIYEHIFDNSIFDNISTHCINMAFDYNIDSLKDLPKDEHEEYNMFSIDEIMSNERVHDYVRNFFKEDKGIK